MKKSPFKKSVKQAFTMIELLFVIIVIGVLAAVIIPRTQTNPLQEAAVQLLADIRYTQHLAMANDKYDTSEINWYKGRWQLIFYKGVNSDNLPTYTIFSDASAYTGDPSINEIAKDPQNPSLVMSGGYSGSAALDTSDTSFIGRKKMNLGVSYGITNYTLSGGCSGARLTFDYMGRPISGDHSTMTGPYSAATPRLISSDCLITITDGVNNAVITVRPETGYASVSYP